MGNNWSVLVVEPEKRLNDLIQQTFRQQGLTIFSALDSHKGLVLLNQEKIDLVVTEAHFPAEEAFTFLTEIRRFTSIPVIIVSDLVADTQRIQSFKLGADDYLAKPFNQQELWLRGQRLLKYFYD